MTINDTIRFFLWKSFIFACVILITTVSIFIIKLVSSKIHFRIQHDVTQFLHITKNVFSNEIANQVPHVTEHEELSLNSPVYTVPGSRFFPVLL